MTTLADSAQYLKGVGPRRYLLLERLGLRTIRDVLCHFPRDYQDLRAVVPIADLVEGRLQSVRAKVLWVSGRTLPGNRALVEVTIADGSGDLTLAWFNQPFQQDRFEEGQWIVASGKPRRYRQQLQIVNALCAPIEADSGDGPGYPLLPVYPLTEDLKPHVLRRVIAGALDAHVHEAPELFPEAFRRERQLISIGQALRWIHRPADDDQRASARRRLVYEEFFLLELALALRRRDLDASRQAPSLEVTPRLDGRIRRLFPFRFTPGQEKAIGEIAADLARPAPMNRLLQGDVGSGKTAVALYALLVAVARKHQAALMAPTEVLARQHWQNVERYLAHSQVRRTLLIGNLTAAERTEALGRIAEGEIDLVVGTQAIIQKDVRFERLGVVVVDEQHKFGVRQRARFRGLGVDPHYLVMTATPIPRTLTLTVFGDLDVSTIADMPPGRQPVRTALAPPKDRAEAFEVIRRRLRAGRQAYVVYPLVEESDSLDLKAATDMAEHLARAVFPEFKVGLVHGRLDSDAKQAVMGAFREGKIHVLVSTLVIEVGIDVPNATVMAIEHPDRFGLAQLHQLRGRIARGEHRGLCLLLTDSSVTAEGRERLDALLKTTNGFRIAEEDLRLRGPGEFFGTRQHGLPELRIGNLIDDYDLLKLTRHDAFAIVADDPELSRPDHAAMRQAVTEKYAETLDLGHVG